MKRYDIIFTYVVEKWGHGVISSNLSVLEKMFSFNVFQYEVFNRMSHQLVFYDNFENFQKLNFQWEVEIPIRGVATEKNNFFEKKILGSAIFLERATFWHPVLQI